MNIDLLKSVRGGPELVTWFGYAPRFHDAEVLALKFDRKDYGTCTLVVHGFEMTKDVDPQGFFVLKKHVTVTFVLSGITEVEVEGFSHQNAVMGITLELGRDAEFILEIDPANGLGGIVKGRTLAIAIVPGIPLESQYTSLSD